MWHYEITLDWNGSLVKNRHHPVFFVHHTVCLFMATRRLRHPKMHCSWWLLALAVKTTIWGWPSSHAAGLDERFASNLTIFNGWKFQILIAYVLRSFNIGLLFCIIIRSISALHIELIEVKLNSWMKKVVTDETLLSKHWMTSTLNNPTGWRACPQSTLLTSVARAVWGRNIQPSALQQRMDR